ncbi:MAG: site-2 protease family protein [Dehalococcoidia bacterium]|nr:site-2 protease family protein [Dehalococcoidia bacterium]
MRSIRIGSLFGIPVLVHPAWFALFALTTLILATDVYPNALEGGSTAGHVALAVVSSVLFFASIILHELGHSLVARLYQIPVRSITLFLFGGVAHITRDAARPSAELLMALAGPLVSFAIAAACFGSLWAMGGGGSEPQHVMLLWVGAMNGLLGAFNLLPAFPMDGGRVFHSLLWLITGNRYRASMVAGWTGRLFAWSMMALGALALLGHVVWVFDRFGGVWFIFIGLFLEGAARQSLFYARLAETLDRYRAGDLMVPNPPVVDGQMSIGALARGALDLNPRLCYFIEDEGRLAGLLGAHQMHEVPEALWDMTPAVSAMVPSARLRATSPGQPIADVLGEMENAGLLHMPVVDDGRVVGVISRDRIFGVLRQAGIL